MKKISLLIVLLAAINLITVAQDKYFTKTGTINFAGKSTFGKIAAVNKSVACVLDTKTGSIQFSLLIKGFEFKKALMQTHFNDKYMESDKFSKSEFKGQIVNNSSVKYKTDGVYDVTVEGNLTIHGETKEVASKGKIAVKNGRILLASTFTVQVPDYKIKANMKDEVTISVDCSLDPLKN